MAEVSLSDLIYEWTNDPELLRQYHKIREQEFKARYGAEEHDGSENEYDRTGHTLIVRKGNQCVGGVRLDVKSPEITRPLPLEFGGFSFDKYFPHLKEQGLSYIQISWMSLIPEYKGGEATFEMSKLITKKAVELNCSMFFCAAPILNARVYKRNGSAVGFKDVTIHRDIEVPKFSAFEDLKIYLVSCTFDVDLINQNKNEVPKPELQLEA